MIPKLTNEQIENIRKYLIDIEWALGYHKQKLDMLTTEKELLEAMLATQENDKE